MKIQPSGSLDHSKSRCPSLPQAGNTMKNIEEQWKQQNNDRFTVFCDGAGAKLGAESLVFLNIVGIKNGSWSTGTPNSFFQSPTSKTHEKQRNTMRIFGCPCKSGPRAKAMAHGSGFHKGNCLICFRHPVFFFWRLLRWLTQANVAIPSQDFANKLRPPPTVLFLKLLFLKLCVCGGGSLKSRTMCFWTCRFFVLFVVCLMDRAILSGQSFCDVFKSYTSNTLSGYVNHKIKSILLEDVHLGCCGSCNA